MVSVSGRELLTEFRVPSPKELQELRKKVGLTQAELADSVGISQSLVARIEKGQVNPSISTLKRILKVIEKQKQVHSSVGDLIKWKGQSSKLNPLIWVGPKDTVRRVSSLCEDMEFRSFPCLKVIPLLGQLVKDRYSDN